MGAGTEELTKLLLGLRGNAVGKFFFHPHPALVALCESRLYLAGLVAAISRFRL